MTDVLPSPSAGQDFVDLQSDLQRAQKEMAGPVPLIEPSPDCLVTLVRGLVHNGVPQTQAEVRELTGADEEAFAKYKKPEDVFDAILAYGVVRIGSLSLEDLPVTDRQNHLRSMLIGDRDVLFLAVARVTYGDERTFPVVCDLCQREQDLNLLISEEFKPKEVDLDSPYEFVTSKGLKLEYRLATGADQLEVLGKENISGPEMNTMMLVQCLKSINGGMIVDPLNFARSLPIRDRQGLLQELVDRQPNVELVAKYNCFGCGEERRLALGWLDLFRS